MKNSKRWRLFEQLLFVPKHVTLSQKMRLALPVSIPASCFFDRQAEDAFCVASQHSISLVDIKWGTVMSPQSRCVTCYVQKIPACSHERFPLSEHDSLKAVGRTQIEGSCKVYVGKTNWKTSWKLCLCKQEKHLKHPRGWLLFQEHLVVPKHMTLLQKMRFSVASQHSCVLFFRSAGNTWQDLKGRYSWISQLRLEDLKTVTVYFWTLQRPSDPVFLNLSRVSCMFGCDDIKRVTFTLAGGRYVNSQLVRT